MTYYNRKTNSFHIGDTAPTIEALKIDWMRASVFERQNSALNEVAALTGITQEMIDDFFVEASKL